jgi:circadian clock protein KaiC
MERLRTGIPDLDVVLGGGLLTGSLVVVWGGAGAGKTILAQQICFANAQPDRKAIYYTTLSEPHAKLVRHLEPFTFFDAGALDDRIEFIDVTGLAHEQPGNGLAPVVDEIVRSTFETRPAVVVIDSSRALHELGDEDGFREVVYELASRVGHTDTVLMLVGEYTAEEMARAPECAVADGIVELENERHGPVSRRWLRVLKMRGANHLEGVHSFRIGPGGLEVFPRLETTTPDRSASPQGRTSIGSPAVDRMMGGGIAQGSATLVLGASGTGKTVLSLRFAAQGLEEGEHCLYVSFQETADQLVEKAASFGWDLAGHQEAGRLSIVHTPPVELNLDAIGARIREELLAGDVRRVVIDSLAELMYAARETERLPGYISSLNGFVRGAGASALVTHEAVALDGGIAGAAADVSFLFHNTLVLRYVELDSEMHRALSILKMRDSPHDKGLARFDITPSGFEVLGKLDGFTGLLGWSTLRSAGEREDA